MKNLRQVLRVPHGLMAVLFACSVESGAQAAIVVLQLDMPIDKAAPGGKGPKVGDHHGARIFYDDSNIDPKTHRVPVIFMQHVPEHWSPTTLGDPSMPMPNAWLDLSSTPYRYHYKAAAFLGEMVVVEFNEKTRRMTISKQSDHSMIISAPYIIDPTPVAGVRLVVETASSSP